MKIYPLDIYKYENNYMKITIKITKEQARKILNDIPPHASIKLKAGAADKILGNGKANKKAPFSGT